MQERPSPKKPTGHDPHSTFRLLICAHVAAGAVEQEGSSSGYGTISNQIRGEKLKRKQGTLREIVSYSGRKEDPPRV